MSRIEVDKYPFEQKSRSAVLTIRVKVSNAFPSVGILILDMLSKDSSPFFIDWFIFKSYHNLEEKNIEFY